MSRIYTPAMPVLLLCFLLPGLTNTLSAQYLPHPDHIIILIEENHSNASVIGNTASAPYINQLATDSEGTVLVKMFAIEHPSQPNYLDFFSGSNQGITSDAVPGNYPFTTPNLARQLLDHGLTFATYSQDLPAVGSDVATAGNYARKHNPVTNWVGTGTNQVPDTLNQPFTNFPTDFTMLPTVSYVVPNLDSDMHSGTIQAADFWFKEHLEPLINWVSNPANNSLFIYIFDEDDYSQSNQIPTVFYGPMIKPGNDSTQYNLFAVLRTIEDMYNLGYAGAAATNVPILDCWKTPSAISSVSGSGLVQCFPDPASSILQFQGNALSSPLTAIELTDISGRQIEKIVSNGADNLSLNVSNFSNGLYFYKMISTGLNVQSGKFIVAH